MLHIWKLEGRCASGIGGFQTKSLSKKETKVRTLNFKTFFKVAAVLVVLLTSSYFCFSTILNLTKPELHKQKTFRLPDNSKFY
jgi:hypothetical protein